MASITPLSKAQIRFARDLTVQLTGHDFLRGGCGVMLVRIRTEFNSNQSGL